METQGFVGLEAAIQADAVSCRAILDALGDAVLVYDAATGGIWEVNRKFCELFGYSPAEARRLNVRDLLRNGPALKEAPERLYGSPEWQVWDCRGRGFRVEVRGSLSVLHGRAQACAILREINPDVDERQLAQEALRDSEQKLRLLASQLLTAQEKERRRVSREIHDELGQALTLLKIQLVALEDQLPRDQKALKLSCAHLQNYVDGVIEKVRRLSWDLSPSIVEDLGLSSSLKYLVRDICRNNNMRCQVKMDQIDHLFSAEVKINIYRIFQESLTNIVRHAKAGLIEVQVRRQEDRVTFTLRDNGRGFDLKQVRSRSQGKRGLGLTIMGERALLAGGTVNINSGKGKGTEISITMPIQG